MKFSIIVPVYNVEKYLDKCIESILNQTYTDFELILVDDGSPDNCPKICDDWAQKDSRIVVIHQENAGALHARLNAVQKALGQYLLFVDADDYIENDLLKMCFLNLQDNKDSVVFNFVGDKIFTEKSFVLDTEQEQLSYFLNNVINFYYGGWEFCRRCIKKELLDIDYLKSLPKMSFAEDFLATAIMMPKIKKVTHIKYEAYHYVTREDSTMHSTAKRLFINEVNNIIYFLYKYYIINNYKNFSKNIARIHFILTMSSLLGRINLPTGKDLLDETLKERLQNYNIDNFSFFKQNIKKYKKVSKLKYNECRPWEYWDIQYKVLILKYIIDKSELKLKIRYKRIKVYIWFVVLKRKCIRGFKKIFSKG